MSEQSYSIHYVCTHEKAKEMAFKQKRFWVSNCGCRERNGKCERSRMDVCLMFYDIGSSGSGKREITLPDLIALFEEAENKTPSLDPGELCDRGEMIESTNMDKCNFCGDCAAVCYFGARKMIADELQISKDNCYGCGLCADVCPEDCVEMVRR